MERLASSSRVGKGRVRDRPQNTFGFWIALQEEYGPVAQQRCWVHKTSKAKQLIHENVPGAYPQKRSDCLPMHHGAQKRRNHWHLPLLEFNLFSWCIARCTWLEVRVSLLIKQREDFNEQITRTAAALSGEGPGDPEAECVRQPRKFYLQRRRPVRVYLQLR